MSLNWNLTRIKDNERLCWNACQVSTRTRTGTGTADSAPYPELNSVTHFLIWSTIEVGMNEITAKNVDEFIARVEVIRMLDEAEYGAPIGHSDYPTPDQIRAHIGLNTNASKVPTKKWMARRCEELMLVAKKRVAQATAAND